MADRFPPHIDMDTPSIARMYDYLLGGKDNFEADRKACEELAKGIPELVSFARANRAFLGRAVECVSGHGVEQFLDLGAGLPTGENTHQVAQRINPGARVLYVDHDPIVLAHGRALVADSAGTAFLGADIRETDLILGSAEAQGLIDTDLPVCVMLVSLLHCLPDESDPFGMAQTLMDRLAPGSCVIFSHIVSDDTAAAAWMTDKILSFGTPWGRVRSPEEVSKVFNGLELLSPWRDGRDQGPKAVDCATWRHPERDPLFRPADADVKRGELDSIARSHRPVLFCSSKNWSMAARAMRMVPLRSGTGWRIRSRRQSRRTTFGPTRRTVAASWMVRTSATPGCTTCLRPVVLR